MAFHKIKWFFKTIKSNKFKDLDIEYISCKKDFTIENLNKLSPSYIFFPHWAYIIPKEIFSNYQCIVFHMTDLPYGRGGSPLQNLILAGKKKTKISAIDVVEEIDAGDIFLKKDCLKLRL